MTWLPGNALLPAPDVEGSQPWLQFRGFFEPTSRRIGLAAVLPIGTLFVLWVPGRRTWAQYEAYQAPEEGPAGEGLAAPTFWSGRGQVARLRRLHVASGLALINAVVLLNVLVGHDLTTDAYAGVYVGGASPSAVVRTGVAIAAVNAAVLLASAALLLLPRVVDRHSWSRGAERTVRGLRSSSVLLAAMTLGYGFLPRAQWDAAGTLPGLFTTVTTLFALQIALVGLLVVLVTVHRRRHTHRDLLLGGYGAPIFASLGVGLAIAFSSATSFRIADSLDGAAVPGPATYGPALTNLRPEPPLPTMGQPSEWSSFWSRRPLPRCGPGWLPGTCCGAKQWQ